MAKTRPPYAPEFQRQMVDLVRFGRDPTDLPSAREFEPSAQATRNWIAGADRQVDRGTKPTADTNGLTAVEKEELLRLRRENKQWCMARDILSRATAWFARQTGGDPVRLFEFMNAHQASFPVMVMARTLRVSSAGSTGS